MKTILFLSALLLTGAASAQETVPALCKKAAAQAVEKYNSKPGYYDPEFGFNTNFCRWATNGQVVICEVGASNFETSVTDTYRAVLNAQCTYAYRVDLMYEE